MAKGLNKEEKIDRLVNELDYWDFDTLMASAKELRRYALTKASAKEVDKEFREAFEDNPDNCRHCGRPTEYCYMHCHAVKSGEHSPDPTHIIPSDAGKGIRDEDGIYADVGCENCSITGTVTIRPDDIIWE